MNQTRINIAFAAMVLIGALLVIMVYLPLWDAFIRNTPTITELRSTVQAMQTQIGAK